MPEFYQHEFASVEDYLHHRPPYLLVDRIVSLSERQVVTEKMVTGDEFFLAGHFPGAPILPGAMMGEFSTQSAGILIASKFNPMSEYNTHDPHFNEYALGVLVRVKRAKFVGFARPGDTIRAEVALNEVVGSMFDFSAKLLIGKKLIMKNAFQLTNIKSSILHGHPVEAS